MIPGCFFGAKKRRFLRSGFRIRGLLPISPSSEAPRFRQTILLVEGSNVSLRICCLATLPLLLYAQERSTTPRIARTSKLVAVGSPIEIPFITGSPFSATAVTVIHELSEDGTTTAVKTITVLARDSKGRVYVEDHDPVEVSEAGDGAIRHITISDLVAHSQTELDPAKMVAKTSPHLHASLRSPSTTNDEDLGMSTIAGMSVHGYRHSRTVPLNPPAIQQQAIANGSQPLRSTGEYWFSDKLQMNVMAKTGPTGIRGRTRSITLTQVSLKEPAAALFQIPRGYTTSIEPLVLPEGRTHPDPILRIYVYPTYPPLARSARIQGTVEFVATIGPDGAVKDLELVRGHPLLAKAAREAVLEWVYEPTLQNGKAVSVKTDVIVNFFL